jgi:hypothetical protein
MGRNNVRILRLHRDMGILPMIVVYRDVDRYSDRINKSAAFFKLR